jgi:hypothetical protein
LNWLRAMLVAAGVIVLSCDPRSTAGPPPPPLAPPASTSTPSDSAARSSGQTLPVQQSTRIIALLADARLLVVRSDGTTVAEIRLGASPPINADVATGHYLALSGDGRQVYALAAEQPQAPDHVAVVDVATAQLRSDFPLPDGVTFRSLDIGAQTGRAYLFGNVGEVVRRPGLDPMDQRQVSVLVVVLDPVTGRVEATWIALPPDGHDWRVYKGSVSRDEHRLYVSYHGPDTTGIDWFDITPEGLERCRMKARGNVGCIDAHGGFVVRGDSLLVTDGSPIIRQVDRDGALQRALDTRLEGNHLMDFAVDSRAQRLYAVGSCGYTGGLSVLSLRGGGVPMTPTQPGMWNWITTPEPPLTFRRSGSCGERLALGSSALLVIGKTQRPVPQVDKAGAILVIDPGTGDLVRSVPTPSEPLDVLVVPSTSDVRE